MSGRITAIEDEAPGDRCRVVRLNPFVYHGFFEASAAATLDDQHFVVGSDDAPILLTYHRDKKRPVGSLRLRRFLGDQSDIEASAQIGDRIYWTTSHSRKEGSRGGAKKRSAFFATDVARTGDVPRLKIVGQPFHGLRRAIRKIAHLRDHLDKDKFNIEGLSAAPDGSLLIGLRSPLIEEKALVIRLENPNELIEGTSKPAFRETYTLNLQNRGIRSIDRVEAPERGFLILAGPTADGAANFALYFWKGDGYAQPVLLTELRVENFTAEALVTYPASRLVQVLSDDGKPKRDDNSSVPLKKRRFRSIDVVLGESLSAPSAS